MKSILVVVRGGVAEVVEDTVPNGVSVEIIDFDNLEDLSDPTTPKFSRTAQKFIEQSNPELARRLALRH